MKYSEWREHFMSLRTVEPETFRGDKAIMSTHIAPFFDSKPLIEIKPSTVKAWLSKMSKDGVGHASQVRSFNLLRSSLKMAAQDEILLANPADKVDPPKQQRKAVEWFTPTQVDLICEHLNDRDVAMVTLMSWCGLRWGECAGLRVKDVDWLRRIVSVVQAVTQSGRVKAYPKNDPSRRDIPAPPHVLELLSPLAADREPDDLLFISPKYGNPINASNWRKGWYAAIEAANDAGGKVPTYNPHSLRHTAASWLVQAGVPLSEIQRLLGHSTPTMTNRYAHLAPGAHSAIEGAWKAMNRDPETGHAATADL
jgi:integrase